MANVIDIPVDPPIWPSTYVLFAASVPAVGVATLVIFLLETSIVPVPLAFNTKLPLVFVVVIVFVSISTLPISASPATSKENPGVEVPIPTR